MSWIAEYDTQGMEFPTCVHVTKTTGTMTHGATYVPIEEGKALRTENAKLRKLMARMAEALGIDCEWADPNWCKSPCVLEFGCWPNDEHAEIQCPAWAAMHELGVEV